MKVGDKVQIIKKWDRNYKQQGVIEYFDDQPNADGITAVMVKFKWVSCWFYPEHLKVLKDKNKK